MITVKLIGCDVLAYHESPVNAGTIAVLNLPKTVLQTRKMHFFPVKRLLWNLIPYAPLIECNISTKYI